MVFIFGPEGGITHEIEAFTGAGAVARRLDHASARAETGTNVCAVRCELCARTQYK